MQQNGKEFEKIRNHPKELDRMRNNAQRILKITRKSGKPPNQIEIRKGWETIRNNLKNLGGI